MKMSVILIKYIALFLDFTPAFITTYKARRSLVHFIMRYVISSGVCGFINPISCGVKSGNKAKSTMEVCIQK